MNTIRFSNKWVRTPLRINWRVMTPSSLFLVICSCSLFAFTQSTFVHPYVMELYRRKVSDSVWAFTDSGDKISPSVLERTRCFDTVYNTLNLRSLLTLENRQLPVTKSIWRFSLRKRHSVNPCLSGVVAVQVNFTNLGQAKKVQKNVQFRSHKSSVWIEMDIGNILHDMLQLSSDQAKVRVRTSIRCSNVSCDEELPFRLTDLHAIVPQRKRYLNLQPLLAVYQHEVTKKSIVNDVDFAILRRRSRRYVRSIQRNSSCRLVKLGVNASDVPELHKVILPRKFNMGVCVGHCDLASMLTHPNSKYTNNYAFLATYLFGKGKFPSRACCVPTSYNPLQVVMEEDDSMVTKPIYQLVATNCGCR